MSFRRAAPLLLYVCLAGNVAFAINTWYVNGLTGNDGHNCRSPQSACKTIGHAISLASPGDSILVASAIYRENLNITFSLTLIGSGATVTIIDGGALNSVITVSNASGEVTVSGFTIRNGKAEWGGGVYNTGALTINKCTLSGNTSTGKLFRGAQGGAVMNFGTLRVIASTLSANTARGGAGGAGGGLFNAGPAIIVNSTIASNQTAGGGGGIYNTNTISISSTTISSNSSGLGGGIYTPVGSATTQNSIFANNTAQTFANCGGSVTSDGYNLSSDGSCAFTGPGDLNNTNPNLGSLQYNGGTTQTMALQSGSPAIDAGNPAGCTDGTGGLLTTDQRGAPRPDSDDVSGCDIGAYELQI